MSRWKTQSGEKLEVSSMTTNHIQNCLNGLKNGRNFGTVSIVLDHFEKCGGQVLSDESGKWITIFQRELNKRKLT